MAKVLLSSEVSAVSFKRYCFLIISDRILHPYPLPANLRGHEDVMASNEELQDLDDLVREVIEENPPEEQGIRPEWINHEGWHRKENIFNLRGREEKDAATSELHRKYPAHIDESNNALSDLQKDHTNIATLLSSASIMTVLVMSIIYVHKYYCKSNMPCSCSLKPRKTEADLV